MKVDISKNTEKNVVKTEFENEFEEVRRKNFNLDRILYAANPYNHYINLKGKLNLFNVEQKDTILEYIEIRKKINNYIYKNKIDINSFILEKDDYFGNSTYKEIIEKIDEEKDLFVCENRKVNATWNMNIVYCPDNLKENILKAKQRIINIEVARYQYWIKIYELFSENSPKSVGARIFKNLDKYTMKVLQTVGIKISYILNDDDYIEILNSAKLKIDSYLQTHNFKKDFDYIEEDYMYLKYILEAIEIVIKSTKV